MTKYICKLRKNTDNMGHNIYDICFRAAQVTLIITNFYFYLHVDKLKKWVIGDTSIIYTSQLTKKKICMMIKGKPCLQIQYAMWSEHTYRLHFVEFVLCIYIEALLIFDFFLSRSPFFSFDHLFISQTIWHESVQKKTIWHEKM